MRIYNKIKQAIKHAAGLSANTGLPYDVSSGLYKLINTVKPYTMSGPPCLSMLHGLAREAVTTVKGDVVECGVRNGGSAAILAAAINTCPDRKLWLYDTFEGIPAPGPKDTASARQYEGQWKGSIKSVKEIMEKIGFSPDQAIFQKGAFRDTFKNALPDKIAFLHVDCDWHESVLCTLNTFYPLIPDGGIVVLDDFGHWDGARKAFYDFCAKENIQPLIERAGHSQLFWHKGKENNRDTWDRYFLGVYYPKAKA